MLDEWGFDGVVNSDYAAVAEALTHGACDDHRDAAKKAINATCDIDMNYVCENGEFTVFIGTNSKTENQASFTLQ